MRRVSYGVCAVLFCVSALATSEDDTQPIKVTSQSAVFNLNVGQAVYQGDVLVTQGQRQLKGNSLTVKRGTNGKVESFKAEGTPAKTQDQPSPNAKMAYGQAKTIYYFPEQGLVKYVNDAKFTQGGNVFSGDEITYNTKTEVVTTPQTKKGTGQTTIILPAYDQGDKTAS